VSASQSNHTAQSSELTTTFSDRTASPLDVESFDNVAFFCLEKVNRLFDICSYFARYIFVTILDVTKFVNYDSEVLFCFLSYSEYDHFLGKLSTMGQPIRPVQPSVPPGSANE